MVAKFFTRVETFLAFFLQCITNTLTVGSASYEAAKLQPYA